MAAGWVDDVRDLWVEDEPIDLRAMDKKWRLRTFEKDGGEVNSQGELGERGKILCCLTGFDERTFYASHSCRVDSWELTRLQRS